MGLQETPASEEMAAAGQRESFELAEKAVVVDPGGPIGLIESVPNFFATAEGFYDYENFRYIYQYKDQVGNVRLSYAKNTVTNIVEVVDRNDYYPFGLSFYQGAEFSVKGSPLNYKFGGKELQESGFYDFGARNYMPDLGRWFGADPLAELAPDLSPYRYAFNNPISFTDPTGMFEEFDDDRGGPDKDQWANKGYDYFFARDSDGGGGSDEKDFGEGMIWENNSYMTDLADDISAYDEKPRLSTKMLSNSNYDADGNEIYDTGPKRRDPLVRADGSRVTNADVNGDGKITLQELGYWYRHGGGEDITIKASSINMKGVDPALFKGKPVGSTVDVNLFFSDFFGEGTLFGQLQFIYNGGDKVSIRPNEYDFDVGADVGKPWFNSPSGFFRNIGTVAGNIVAGPGNPFMINFKGTATLKYNPNK